MFGYANNNYMGSYIPPVQQRPMPAVQQYIPPFQDVRFVNEKEADGYIVLPNQKVLLIDVANKKTAQAKMKYNINTLKNIVSQKGYEIIGGEYKTCMTPMDCRCSKGHTFKVKLINALYGNYGCQICQHEYQRGENHPMYKGGESEVLDNLRKIIKDWKIAIATKYNGKCVLTDTKGDCVVHHIKSFNTLIKETFDELNLQIYRKLKDYTNQQWSDINNLFMKKHTMESGILLQRKVHNKFHSLYGKGNNTYKQFYEFVEKYYPHKLSQFKTD